MLKNIFNTVKMFRASASCSKIVNGEKIIYSVMGAIRWWTRPPTFLGSGNIICHVT